MNRIVNLGFPIDEKLHKKMRMYLFDNKNKMTIKEYVTELIYNDLKNKKICEIRED